MTTLAAGPAPDLRTAYADGHRVFARLDALNHSSIKVCERIGMRREAELRESHLQLGEWRTELIYAALRSDRISAD